MKRIITLALLITSSVFTFAQDETKVKLPDISLRNLYGETINIQDYGKNDKITILSFWATWCTHCKKELTNINEIYEDWVDEFGVELIAISIDNARNAAKVKPFSDGLGLEFEVLLDSNEELKRAMNVTNIPFTYIIDKSGNIVYKHQGYAEGDEYEIEDKLVELNK
ncbi:MAG: thiol:disulfide interchange protein [Bacteroidetes bacterium]|nr:TlpA family protein disulfide reductase [Bacteroidia bacterium]PCH67114.1 MAG: thiol:disulfide interchange protein [Bacteroidota bacterium]